MTSKKTVSDEGPECSISDSADDLVTRAQNGDRRAIERLLCEARPRAMAVAMKVLRNPSDAEDAVQDALTKIWRYLPRFEGRASFFTWIHRIVMNSSLDLMRREKVRGDLRDEIDDSDCTCDFEPAHQETPEALLASKQTSLIVREAMSVLSPVHSEVLAMREFEENSYEEIAELSHCPIGTVMSRLHHARRRLATELVDNFGSHASVWAQAA
jgi:RNA polymerase sigma-70 factor, ECF subfamily